MTGRDNLASISTTFLNKNVNEHPTDATLAAFVRRTADAGSLIELDRHLAACADCRARLRSITGAADTLAALQRHISTRGAEHLTFEDVQALAENRASTEAAQHARVCPLCQAEVEDLRSVIVRTAPRRQWYWAVAAAVFYTCEC